jgi:glutathione peroxidase
MGVNVADVVVTTASGEPQRLGDLAGQVLLIVNVASRCGFTAQYEGLQKLQETFGDRGFSVLAFPCNDFGAQEPGELEEIKTFCSTNYGVTFPLYAKVHATGATTAPYDTLTKVEPAGDVAWNFEKFLVGRDGTVLARFKSAVKPDSAELTSAIETALAA